MDHLFCKDISIFAFPANLIALLFLVTGTWFLHRYYSRHRFVKWLCSVPATLLFTGLTIGMLVVEGIWALELYRTWIMIVIQLTLLLILELVVLKRSRPLSRRNVVFLLNHAGLWIALAFALFGAPDREEYKMIAPLHQKEYTAFDANGVIYPLPFTVRLDRFELEYYPGQDGQKVPKRFCSSLTLESGRQQKSVQVEVNKPASFKGYTLYQDGYDQNLGENTPYSIMLVVKDPWISGVYAGIFLLLAGAIGLIIYGPVKKLNA